MCLSGSPSPGALTRTRTRALLLQRCCSAAVTLNHIHRSLLISPTQIGFSVFYGVFSSPWPHQMDQKIALCREEDLEVTRASLPTRVSFIRTAQVSECIDTHIYISVYCIDICGGELDRQQLPLAWLAWCLYTHAWRWSASCRSCWSGFVVLMLRWRAGLPRDWWICRCPAWGARVSVNLCFTSSVLCIYPAAVNHWPLHWGIYSKVWFMLQ